jgi:uncharacterized OB-fold protein
MPFPGGVTLRLKMDGLNGINCRHCGHAWFPRKKRNPDRCPSCQKLYPVEDKRVLEAGTPAVAALASATAGEMEYLTGLLKIMRSGDAAARVIKGLVDMQKGPPKP